MATEINHEDVSITEENLKHAICFTRQALGNGRIDRISDIVYVKPASFQISDTEIMADEIGKINAILSRESRPYLLIGPGRWGSADRWLGIPVQWHHISGTGAMIELKNAQIHADPSQGSHFFQNITSIGIPYLTVDENADDMLNWDRIESYPEIQSTRFIRHVRPGVPIVVKLQGAKSLGVIYENHQIPTGDIQ